MDVVKPAEGRCLFLLALVLRLTEVLKWVFFSEIRRFVGGTSLQKNRVNALIILHFYKYELVRLLLGSLCKQPSQ